MSYIMLNNVKKIQTKKLGYQVQVAREKYQNV